MEQSNTLGAGSAPVAFSAEESRYRLLQPGFLTPEECATLIELVEKYGKVGDGYEGNPHPHTPTELFGGYNFHSFDPHDAERARLHRESLKIMLRARDLLKKHFGLWFLWLDYGHLVFREPTGEVIDDDVSHPWHFDNQSEGVKHRTHTAILYLNDNFEGGLTRFKETDFGPYREIQPEAGKLAGFDVDKNAHGVSKLRSGRRYVLNMWFSTHMRVYKSHRHIFKNL